MGELREIVDTAALSRLFLLLAIVGPAAGGLLGALAGHRRQAIRRGGIIGLWAGLLLTLNYLLWLVYNRITDAAGIDTVKNVVINLALFIVVGVLLGMGIGWAQRRTGSDGK